MNAVAFARIVKVDERTRTVVGRAAQECVDRDGEVFDYASSKPAFKAWSDSVYEDTNGMSRGNVRAMHGNVAAGIVTELNFNDSERAIDITARIVDDQEWKKITSGTYSGFSIGGKYLKRWPDSVDGKVVNRYTAAPSEISIVDRPCIPTAKFFGLSKRDGSTVKVAFKNTELISKRDNAAADPDDLSSKANAASTLANTTGYIRDHQTAADMHADAADAHATVGDAESDDKAEFHGRAAAAHDRAINRARANKSLGYGYEQAPSASLAKTQSDAGTRAFMDVLAKGQRRPEPFAVQSRGRGGQSLAKMAFPDTMPTTGGEMPDTGGTRPAVTDNGTPTGRATLFGRPSDASRKPVPGSTTASGAAAATDSSDQQDSISAIKLALSQPPKNYLS